jgi:hypothetical protein
MLNLTNSNWLKQCSAELHITESQCLNLIISKLHQEHGLPRNGESIQEWLTRAPKTHRQNQDTNESLRAISLPLSETIKSIRLYITQLHYAKVWTPDDTISNPEE